MPLPDSAPLSLQVNPNAVQSKPKRAMIVRMSAETLDALDAFPNHPPLSFDFGDLPVSALHLSIPPPPHPPPPRASTSEMPSFRCALRRRALPMNSTSVPPPLPNPWHPSSSMPMSLANSWSSASSVTRSQTKYASRRWSQNSSIWNARPSFSTSPRSLPTLQRIQSARCLALVPSSRRLPLQINTASPPPPSLPSHLHSHHHPGSIPTSDAVSFTVSPYRPAFPKRPSGWSVAPT